MSGKKRWEEVSISSHELYNVGHLYEAAVAYFAGELTRLFESLSEWSGHNITNSDIKASIEHYNQLPLLFAKNTQILRTGNAAGEWPRGERR